MIAGQRESQEEEEEGRRRGEEGGEEMNEAVVPSHWHLSLWPVTVTPSSDLIREKAR